MRDIKSPLQTAYHTALDGNVQDSSSNNVPVHDRVQNTVNSPYIRLGIISDSDESDKTRFNHNCTFEVEVVTVYDGNHGGKKEAQFIADQVIQIIRTRSSGYLDLSANNMNLIRSVLLSSTEVDEDRDNQFGFRYVMTFGHYIEEL